MSAEALKVTASHLARNAYLYIRQSTLKQVLHNTESAIRQYDLRGKAIALGWDASQITVRPGMLPAGPQQRRLAPAAGTVRHDRHPDLRRRRALRPAQL